MWDLSSPEPKGHNTLYVNVQMDTVPQHLLTPSRISNGMHPELNMLK